MKTLTILGATGSIGQNTLDVVARHPEQFRIHALSAHQRIEQLIDLCGVHRAEVAVVPSMQAAQQARDYAASQRISVDIAVGEAGLCQVAADTSVDAVMAAIVGAAGLPPVLAAARAGKQILLANKEALVMAGQLLMDEVQQHHATLLPVDSEHNAIFQCLPVNARGQADTSGVQKLILTASGGPFRGRALSSLKTITPEQACAHPKWVMGQKISVDSATMMNKGLEVIEAHWLFGMSSEQIEVVVHPQSVVHSLVQYRDGSVLAQLGNPDMRTPIAHALAWPQRIDSGVPSLDLLQMTTLQFEAPDHALFPCLSLAYQALKMQGAASIWLNAANEVAVAAFLQRRLPYLGIADVLTHMLERCPTLPCNTLEAILAADGAARRLATQLIQTETVRA